MKNILFYFGTTAIIIAAICSIIVSTVIKNEKTKKVLKWVSIGFSLAAFICFIVHLFLK